MRVYKRPKLANSKCIEFDACRWNGLKRKIDADAYIKKMNALKP